MARWLTKMLALLALVLWTASVVEAFEEHIVRESCSTVHQLLTNRSLSLQRLTAFV